MMDGGINNTCTLSCVSKRANWTKWLELFITFRITNLIDVDGFVHGNWLWKEKYATRLETTIFDYSTRLHKMIKKQRKAKKLSSVWWKRFSIRWALMFIGVLYEWKHTIENCDFSNKFVFLSVTPWSNGEIFVVMITWLQGCLQDLTSLGGFQGGKYFYIFSHVLQCIWLWSS